jgi:7-carboxy-7-deazaguanine synthase
MKKLPVLEIFGPTIQGEGMVVGQKTMFVRTAGCDYSCSWCDSAFTWDGSAKEEIRMMTAKEIWEELKRIGGDRFNHVTISGGNPALLSHLDELLDIFQVNEVASALETQGSRWQDWFLEIDDLTISPKPPSSGMVTNFEILDGIIAKLSEFSNGNYSLKVVIFDDGDLDYASKVHQRYPNIPFYIQTGNPIVSEKDDEVLIKTLLQRFEALTDQVMNRTDLLNVRVLPQLHTLIWGNKRGV